MSYCPVTEQSLPSESFSCDVPRSMKAACPSAHPTAFLQRDCAVVVLRSACGSSFWSGRKACQQATTQKGNCKHWRDSLVTCLPLGHIDIREKHGPLQGAPATSAHKACFCHFAPVCRDSLLSQALHIEQRPSATVAIVQGESLLIITGFISSQGASMHCQCGLVCYTVSNTSGFVSQSSQLHVQSE